MSMPEENTEDNLFSDDPFTNIGDTVESEGNLTEEDIDTLLTGHSGVNQPEEIQKVSEENNTQPNEHDLEDPLAELWEYMERNNGEIPEEIIDALLSGKPEGDQIDLDRFSNRMGLTIDEINELLQKPNSEDGVR